MPDRAMLADYRHLATGKVRELYEVDDDLLLMVASDRISAYDHVLPTPDPGQGPGADRDERVLVRAARRPGAEPCRRRRRPAHPGRGPGPGPAGAPAGRCCRWNASRAATSPGPAWSTTGAPARSAASPLPPGLVEASKLPEPIFTPATKADLGEHDENVTFEARRGAVGGELAEQLRDADAGALLQRPASTRRTRACCWPTPRSSSACWHGDLVLGDEVLTPDSSRFWPADGYRAGGAQPSFDKQYVRDWLTSADSGWDRAADTPPPRCRTTSSQPPAHAMSRPTNGSRAARSSDWPG